MTTRVFSIFQAKGVYWDTLFGATSPNLQRCFEKKFSSNETWKSPSWQLWSRAVSKTTSADPKKREKYKVCLEKRVKNIWRNITYLEINQPALEFRLLFHFNNKPRSYHVLPTNGTPEESRSKAVQWRHGDVVNTRPQIQPAASRPSRKALRWQAKHSTCCTELELALQIDQKAPEVANPRAC